ncbi:MAG TPA: hypothetical protein VFV33_01705 [Gemmatimonadaceae bacterium]|nr:hypothetical protein [Gemmatimonadaceae bacterium]
MGFFDRFRTRQIADVALGTLEFRRGAWRGRLALPALGDAALVLPGDANSPAEEARALVVDELPRRWPALQQAVADALFEHYVPYRDASEELGLDEVGDAIPAIARAADVWRHVRDPLVRIADTGDGLEVRFAFDVAWDVEHTVGILVRDWSLYDVSGSVLRDDL